MQALSFLATFDTVLSITYLLSYPIVYEILPLFAVPCHLPQILSIVATPLTIVVRNFWFLNTSKVSRLGIISNFGKLASTTRLILPKKNSINLLTSLTSPANSSTFSCLNMCRVRIASYKSF